MANRTRKEIDAEAKANQKAHRAAEAVALALLLRARNSAVKSAATLALAGDQMQRAIRDGIILARTGARRRGLVRLAAEAGSVGAGLPDIAAIAHAELGKDWRRGSYLGRSYADRWSRQAANFGAEAANAATRGALDRIAATESSEAFTSSRSAVADAIERDATAVTLLRVWDAFLDACPICEAADGTIVGIAENFPAGEPGSVHPRCRCMWTLLSAKEGRDLFHISRV